jgi:probable rRNA maturation factor
MAELLTVTNLTADKILASGVKKAGERFTKVLNIKKAVSVVLVGEAKIRALNKKYRHKDKVTDVLSFGDWGDKEFLGEIVICLPQIKRQAKQFGVSAREEMIRMLAHGFLHLTGLDHEKSQAEEKKMFKKQEDLVKKYDQV